MNKPAQKAKPTAPASLVEKITEWWNKRPLKDIYGRSPDKGYDNIDEWAIALGRILSRYRPEQSKNRCEELVDIKGDKKMKASGMYICDDGHESIVTEEYKCPLCEALKKMQEQEEKIYSLEEDVKILKEEKKDLENELNNK